MGARGMRGGVNPPGGESRMHRLVRLLVVLALAGCAPGRLADLRDAVHGTVGSGKGLSVDAALGFLTQPSIGLYGAKTVSLGVDSRDAFGFMGETRVSAPYAYSYARAEGRGVLASLNSAGWRTTYSVTNMQRGFEEVDKPLRPLKPREFDRVIEGRRYGGRAVGSRWLPLPSAADEFSPLLTFSNATELQLGAHIGIFAARAGVNPLELVDFLLGFGGLDIAGDDPAPGAEEPRGEAME
jgi:hypothetical protein